MLKQGDYVVYSNSGICRVEDTIMLNMMQKGDKEYYLLIPINEKTSKIYLPVGSIDERIRMAMNKEQAMQLINNAREIDEIYVRNDKERENVYKDATMSNDPYKLVSVLKTILERKTEREKSGKKTTTTDDKYLKLVEGQLYGELSHALQMEKEQIKQLMLQNLF